MAVAKKKTVKRRARPVKRLANVITRSKAKKDDIVEIKFKPLEFDKDGTPKHFPVEHQYDGKLALQNNLKFILAGGRCAVLDVSRKGDRIKVDAGPGSYPQGWVKAASIDSIEVVDRIRTIKVDSMSYGIKFKGDTMEVECQEVTRKDVQKIFEVMADWLGYDLS